MSDVWANLHKNYQKQSWINQPSIFAQQAVEYFPSSGKVLELGCGQAQDGRFFSERGYDVVSTDVEESALKLAQEKTSAKNVHISFQNVDLREELPFENDAFDVVYAHLSIHYFDSETTTRLINEIERVLKPGGIFAFLVNSVNDPEYKEGKEIEPDYFQVKDAKKRYFSVDTARNFVAWFDVNLLDSLGETYKDGAKGVHNLIRYIGTKPTARRQHSMAIPYVGAIIERSRNGKKELLMQTRWKPNSDPLYSGTLEFPAGVLDKPYENVYDTLSREIQEEAGLKLKAIRQEDRTRVYHPKKTDSIFAFKPFCCTQQLKDGRPWIGFVFVCEVEDGEPVSQLSEAKDAQWIAVEDVRKIFKQNPEQIFGLELPAFEYYFNELT